MAGFGKVNFSVAFNPTSAFPLDARCYFTSLEAAQAAAATAEEAGSTNTQYFYGQKLLVYEGEKAKWYTIQPGGNLVSDDGGAVSLLVDDVVVPVDNASEPEATDDPETYSLEII